MTGSIAICPHQGSTDFILLLTDGRHKTNSMGICPKNQQPEKVVVGGGGWWCDLSTGLRIHGTEIPLLLDLVNFSGGSWEVLGATKILELPTVYLD